jgi:hypothetical protein
VALSNGVQFAGTLGQAYSDGVFTLVQPLRGTSEGKDNTSYFGAAGEFEKGRMD